MALWRKGQSFQKVDMQIKTLSRIVSVARSYSTTTTAAAAASTLPQRKNLVGLSLDQLQHELETHVSDHRSFTGVQIWKHMYQQGSFCLSIMLSLLISIYAILNSIMFMPSFLYV